MVEARSPLTPVAEAFTACQKTVACHKKYILLLDKQRKQSPEEFAAEFKASLGPILTVFKREPAVERLVAFTSKFVAIDENGVVDSTLVGVELLPAQPWPKVLCRDSCVLVTFTSKLVDATRERRGGGQHTHVLGGAHQAPAAERLYREVVQNTRLSFC